VDPCPLRLSSEEEVLLASNMSVKDEETGRRSSRMYCVQLLWSGHTSWSEYLLMPEADLLKTGFALFKHHALSDMA
jgi:hypothetical protein